MDLSNSVLIVVDVQNGFVRSHSRHVVPAIVRLVQEWQKAGGDTVFTRFLNYENSPYERIIGWKRMREVPETDLIPELAPYTTGSTILEKTIYTPLHRGRRGARQAPRLDRPGDLRHRDRIMRL